MTTQEKSLREDLGRLSDQMQGIVDTADNEGRDMTDAEVKNFDRLEAQAKSKKKELQNMGVSFNGDQPASPNGNARDVMQPARSSEQGVQIWESASGPTKGQQIRVLGRGRSLYQDLRSQHPADFDKYSNYSWADYIRGRINGDTRLMDTSADSQLVPTPLSAQVIDKARNMSRIFQAGALTVPMSSKTLDIARVTDDVDSEWKAEGSAFTQSDVTVDKVTFTAKTLIAGTRLTVELSEDAPNASEVIQNSIAEKLALELDRVALVGSGSGQEPEGLFNNANVNEVSMGANGSIIDDFTELSQGYQRVLEANGTPNAAIFAPRTWGQIDRLTDNDGNPLRLPQSWQDLQRLVTNQVPIDQTQGTETDSSTVFIGDYSQLLVGMRTQLRLEVSRSASDSNNSAWENLELWIRGYLRADVQFAHPDHFSRVIGLIGTVGT